jgi:hypothetical protein
MQKLNDLNTRYFILQTGQGLGEFLEKKMISEEKKWLLETKEFKNEACLNRTIIAEAGQQIVACQDAKEIRISAQWFATASAVDRAGLILHETILMVVQKKLSRIPTKAIR